MPSTKSTSQKWLLPTNCNPYGRNLSDRQQPGAPSRLVDADALGGALKFYPRRARAAEVIRRGPARHESLKLKSPPLPGGSHLARSSNLARIAGCARSLARRVDRFEHYA